MKRDEADTCTRDNIRYTAGRFSFADSRIHTLKAANIIKTNILAESLAHQMAK